MGFVRGNVLTLLKEHKQRPFSGHCLCLGQADVYITYDTLVELARIARVALFEDVELSLSYKPELAMKNYISRETLFKSIGFDYVSALDYSKFEKAEYVFDLNSPEVPDTLKNKFDTVIDHGTIEHVFHIPNVFNNIFQMLKCDGRVVHTSPSSNYLDHGFYMFSPTLFNDYYSQNNWDIHNIQIMSGYPQRQEYEHPFFADYIPGMFDQLGNGGLDDKAYVTHCIAQKTEKSSSTIIPQQGHYSRISNWDTDHNLIVELQDFNISSPFDQESGYCWIFNLQEYGITNGDSATHPTKSPLVLVENGVEIGHPHSMHDTIRNYGRGCYSHWGCHLYFSTSDNTNPNSNGRRYQIRAVKN
ncbi:MAG: class I SAM-dependent methyltransferase [Blastocatellia bacterium]